MKLNAQILLKTKSNKDFYGAGAVLPIICDFVCIDWQFIVFNFTANLVKSKASMMPTKSMHFVKIN